MPALPVARGDRAPAQVLTHSRLRDPEPPGNSHLCLLLAEVGEKGVPLTLRQVDRHNFDDDRRDPTDHPVPLHPGIVVRIVGMPRRAGVWDVHPGFAGQMGLPEEGPPYHGDSACAITGWARAGRRLSGGACTWEHERRHQGPLPDGRPTTAHAPRANAWATLARVRKRRAQAPLPRRIEELCVPQVK